ncbi:MAG: TolC family protein [Ignavibacteria bacterium]
MKLILLNILIFSNLSFGQPDSSINDYGNFGLNDLISSALKTNLNLEPIEYEKKILSAKINQVNKQPSPMLQFMIDYLPVNLDNAGEFSLLYSQPLRLFGKLGAEENLAKQNAYKPVITKIELENELIKSIKENYFMLSVSERLLEFNYEFQQILISITKSIEIRYSVGKGNQYEIMKSNNELQKLLLEEIDLRNNKNILVNNLETLSNLDLPNDYKTKNIEILLNISPLELDTSELITIMKVNNTDFQYLDLTKEENILERKISELERKPDLTLMSGYRYLSKSKTNTLLFSISLDLPFMPWNSKRIDAIIEQKNLTEKKINSELKALKQNRRNELRNILIKMNSSLEKIKYISAILIPQTEQTFKSALIGYETTSNEFIDLLDTYRSTRENNRMLIEEEINYLILISDLEKLVGKEILTIN